jgi:AGCS family alanine or glycine:cation symporter
MRGHPPLKLVGQLFVIFTVFLNCFSSRAAGIDERINSVMEPISSAVAGFIFFEANIFGAQLPLIILWLVGAAFFSLFILDF